MKFPKKITDLIDEIIEDALALLKTSINGNIQDREGLLQFSNKLILLRKIGGNVFSPWANRLEHNGIVISNSEVEYTLSALEIIKYAIEKGLLNSYHDLIVAEAFTNLYEQGQHLFKNGYIIAAGVIFRAVIEEKLRELCVIENCFPKKNRPTINDLNQALYNCETINYDKATMMNISALSTVGNDAAHAKETLKHDDVKRLMDGTIDFISKFSPSE